MTNEQIKDILDWIFPKKIKSFFLKMSERLRNHYQTDQNVFKKK